MRILGRLIEYATLFCTPCFWRWSFSCTGCSPNPQHSRSCYRSYGRPWSLMYLLASFDCSVAKRSTHRIPGNCSIIKLGTVAIRFVVYRFIVKWHRTGTGMRRRACSSEPQTCADEGRAVKTEAVSLHLVCPSPSSISAVRINYFKYAFGVRHLRKLHSFAV